MTDVVLVLNSGSSSLKFAVYPVQARVAAHNTATHTADEPLIRGEVAGIGSKPVLSANDDAGAIAVTEPLNDIPAEATHSWLITQLLERLQSRYTELNPVAAGHRIVHGGTKYTSPVMINAGVLHDLDELTPMAPLHQPLNLAAVWAIQRAAPGLAQVACFDTSFHRTQPRLAQLYALPRKLTDSGLIRYGFHGLSYEYIAGVLPQHLGTGAAGRVIVAHLGNGASICAMKDRKSIATTMGFTALDGLPMGRRCGDLDPGLVLYLLEQKGMRPFAIQKLLYQQSGLLGVSGLSNNMQVLQASADPAAREAIDLFCYRAARELASLVGALGGLDALIFTAGIGENSAMVRKAICQQAAWLGIALDDAANEQNALRISSAASRVETLVIPTNEQAVIAASTVKLIRPISRRAD